MLKPLNILNAFRQGTFETVRKVDKQGNSQFLRYRQTKQRYHSEPLIRVLDLKSIAYKSIVPIKQHSSVYKQIAAQLKVQLKQQLIQELELKFIKGILSKPQLTHLIKSLNEGIDYDTVTKPETLKPFSIELIQTEDLSKYANFNQFIYAVNKKYRSHIFDYNEFKNILQQYWKTKTN